MGGGVLDSITITVFPRKRSPIVIRKDEDKNLHSKYRNKFHWQGEMNGFDDFIFIFEKTINSHHDEILPLLIFFSCWTYPTVNKFRIWVN